MYPSRTPRDVSSVLLIVPSLLSSRMFLMDLLAIFKRLQFFVHPPDVHWTAQDPAQAVLHAEGAVEH